MKKNKKVKKVKLTNSLNQTRIYKKVVKNNIINNIYQYFVYIILAFR